MDPSLFNAAREGNTQTLLDLLQTDPLILERSPTTTADTPLHVAAMLGHLDFIQVLLGHKKNPVAYLSELNQHGFSATHVAAANGYVDIVMYLLNASPELCFLRGKDGLSPLHCASIKGRHEVVKEILKVSPTCVSVVNVRKENALHLAVKNNQIGVLEDLVIGVAELQEYEILNAQDYERNSILHLAAARRNHEVLEFLLICNHQIPVGLMLNAINQSGLTPLDLIQLCPCESNYNDTERLLKRAGGEKACDLNNIITQNSQQIPKPAESQALAKVESTSTPTTQPREEILSWEEYFKYDYNRSKPDTTRTDLLVLTVLFATTTYQAVLSPPGGLEQEGPKQGQAVLASTNPFGFIWFILFNSIGFFMCLNLIAVLTSSYPMFWDLYMAIFAMVVTYDSAIYTISAEGYMHNLVTVFSIVLPSLIYYSSNRLRKYIKQRGLFAYKRTGANV